MQKIVLIYVMTCVILSVNISTSGCRDRLSLREGSVSIHEGTPVEIASPQILTRRGSVVDVTDTDIERFYSIPRTLPIRPPANWLSGIRWRPLRHFGPFHYGSDFEQIQIFGSTWYFNDYFSTCPDASWYRQYFGGNLPQNRTPIRTSPPPPTYVPGEYPANPNDLEVLFRLEHITYSSNYGGSVKLTFLSIEDYEYEVRHGQTLWDVSSLEMQVYVVPRAGVFNSTSSYTIYSNNTVHVDFNAYDPVAYEIGSGNIISRLNDTKSNELSEHLNTIGASLINSFTLPAVRFVHGFLHGQFQSEIGTNDFVDMIEISDGFLSMHTRAPIPMLFLETRLSYIDIPRDHYLFYGILFFNGYTSGTQGPLTGWGRFKKKNGRSTQYRIRAVYDEEECSNIWYTWIKLEDLHVAGGLFSDVRLAGDWHYQIYYPCGGFDFSAPPPLSANSRTEYGPITEDIILRDDDGIFGMIGFQYRIRLFFR
jgi:hypothetical protein